jgi:hypothetical protein
MKLYIQLNSTELRQKQQLHFSYVWCYIAMETHILNMHYPFVLPEPNIFTIIKVEGTKAQ